MKFATNLLSALNLTDSILLSVKVPILVHFSFQKKKEPVPDLYRLNLKKHVQSSLHI